MILVTICGRGGSKGVPNKNLRLIDGKPLVYFSINIANKILEKYPGRIALSTDSLEIKKAASEYGLITNYIRPADLASDTAGKIEVLRDLLEFEEKNNNMRYDYLLDLDITSPLRTTADLINAFEFITKDPDALNLFSVSPARKNPYFNMVEENQEGYYKLVKPLGGDILSRQKAPSVYELNASFYFYRRKFFDENYKSAITPKSLIYEMPNTCIDIDDESGFMIVKYLIENNIIKTV